MSTVGEKSDKYYQHTQIDYREHVPKWTCNSRGEVRKTKRPPALLFYSTRFYKFPYQLGRLVEACRLLSDNHTYENEPDVMCAAMEIGWTQNVVILGADLTLAERAWYIRAVGQFD